MFPAKKMPKAGSGQAVARPAAARSNMADNGTMYVHSPRGKCSPRPPHRNAS